MTIRRRNEPVPDSGISWKHPFRLRVSVRRPLEFEGQINFIMERVP